MAVGITDFGCFDAPTLQLTHGQGRDLDSPLDGGPAGRCVCVGRRSESSRWVAGSVHYALGAATAAMVRRIAIYCYAHMRIRIGVSNIAHLDSATCCLENRCK